MATVRQLTEILSEELGEPLATVKGVARALLDADLLPRAQGKRVPEVTFEHIALLLFGIYGAGVVREAPTAAVTYFNLRRGGCYAPDGAPESVQRAVRETPTAGECVAMFLREKQVKFIEIVQSWPAVTVILLDEMDAEATYVLPGEHPDRWQTLKPRRAALIPGSCVEIIGNRIAAVSKAGAL